jgi:hypothetical protein
VNASREQQAEAGDEEGWMPHAHSRQEMGKQKLLGAGCTWCVKLKLFRLREEFGKAGVESLNALLEHQLTGLNVKQGQSGFKYYS